MSIDFNMWRAISSTLNNRVAHDKESFKKDYNRFVLKRDELSRLRIKRTQKVRWINFYLTVTTRLLTVLRLVASIINI